MQSPVEVKLVANGEWRAAVLTDERSESSYGLPVVVVDGETVARGSSEIYLISYQLPTKGCGAQHTEEEMASLAWASQAGRTAGYQGSHC